MIYVGVDDGHAETKVVTANGELKIPSRAADGAKLMGIGNNTASATASYETEGQKFTVGESQSGVAIMTDDYHGSDVNRVIIHHALRMAGLGGQDVCLGVGLPVGSYFRNGQINRELIERKTASLLKPVNGLEPGELVNIKEIRVFAQGVSAYVDYALDSEGNLADFKYPIGFVDIGGGTTDCGIVIPPATLDGNKTGSDNVGALNIYADVEARLKQKNGWTEIDPSRLEEAVKTGILHIFGKKLDVSNIVNDVKAEIEARIITKVRTYIGDGAKLDHVLFMGGGAMLLPNIARHYPHGVMLDNPAFANARGMYKFLTQVL